MDKFNELLQKYVNLDYASLVSIAKEAVAKLLPTFVKFDEKNKGACVLTAVALSALGSDGKLTQKEFDFIKDSLGTSDETTQKLVSLYTPQTVELTDKIADSLDVEGKSELLTFLICIAASDDTISREENAFLRKILD